MAFERDPKKQIQVVLFDYNSLEEFQGSLIFQEGLSRIQFKGRPLKKHDGQQ